MKIYVDADACPVKREVYRVAERHGLEVLVVANGWMEVPKRSWIRFELVPGGFDEADDWIAERVGPGDLVISSDIPLAARCVKAGARVLGPKGRVLDEESIGDALATRDLLDDLRSAGQDTRGPAPFQPKDRSRFLQALESLIQAIKRELG